MKIAIPLHHGSFSEHFGGADAFHICQGDPATGAVTAGEVAPTPAHAPGVLPRWLAGHHIDAVVATSIGVRALTLLEEAGITIFLAGEGRDPSGLARACLAGTLTKATRENNACSGHHHHDHDHHGHDGHDCGH